MKKFSEWMENTHPQAEETVECDGDLEATVDRAVSNSLERYCHIERGPSMSGAPAGPTPTVEFTLAVDVSKYPDCQGWNEPVRGSGSAQGVRVDWIATPRPAADQNFVLFDVRENP